MRPPVKGDKMPVITGSSSWGGSGLTWTIYERETARYWINTNGTKWRKDNGHVAGGSVYGRHRVPVDWTDRIDSPKYIELEKELKQARQSHVAVLKALRELEDRAAEAKVVVGEAENQLFSFFTSTSTSTSTSKSKGEE